MKGIQIHPTNKVLKKALYSLNSRPPGLFEDPDPQLLLESVHCPIQGSFIVHHTTREDRNKDRDRPFTHRRVIPRALVLDLIDRRTSSERRVKSPIRRHSNSTFNPQERGKMQATDSFQSLAMIKPKKMGKQVIWGVLDGHHSHFF